jgi:hypothetical protein
MGNFSKYNITYVAKLFLAIFIGGMLLSSAAVAEKSSSKKGKVSTKATAAAKVATTITIAGLVEGPTVNGQGVIAVTPINQFGIVSIKDAAGHVLSVVSTLENPLGTFNLTFNGVVGGSYQFCASVYSYISRCVNMVPPSTAYFALMSLADDPSISNQRFPLFEGSGKNGIIDSTGGIVKYAGRGIYSGVLGGVDYFFFPLGNGTYIQSDHYFNFFDPQAISPDRG